MTSRTHMVDQRRDCERRDDQCESTAQILTAGILAIVAVLVLLWIAKH